MGAAMHLPIYAFMLWVGKTFYSRITSTKSPSFQMTTFSASLIKLTALLPQSRDYSCYVSRPILSPPRSDCRNTLIYAHTNSRTLPTCDISLGSITLPASEAGDFVKLILPYKSLGTKVHPYVTP